MGLAEFADGFDIVGGAGGSFGGLEEDALGIGVFLERLFDTGGRDGVAILGGEDDGIEAESL